MQLEEILEWSVSRTSRTSRTTEFSRAFLDQYRTRPRYAIGKNTETLALHQFTQLDGIIDDFSRQGDAWHGIPLIRAVDAPKDAWVVNCSTSIRPLDTLYYLRASGFQNVIGLSDVICVADGALGWPRFVEAQREEILEHLDAWKEIHDSLADEESRKTLRDVLKFRLSADPTHMRDYRVRTDEQYFEPFMRYSNEVFVDAGGYDGDTSEGFATRYCDYARILLFEPSAKSIARARARLAHFRDIDFFQIGLSDIPGRASFDAESGSASSMSESGEEEITVDTLDSAVTRPVSFIKMDLEGWELPALRGARGHIDADKPKLAVAAYHDAPDLRCIHNFMQTFDHDHKVFLRHYTQGWSETVLYFVPNN
jgi:FkbM family methyltransferase